MAKTTESTSLYFKSGSSDKEYHATIQPTLAAASSSLLLTGAEARAPDGDQDADSGGLRHGEEDLRQACLNEEARQGLHAWRVRRSLPADKQRRAGNRCISATSQCPR